jgi:hypothetical protein
LWTEDSREERKERTKNRKRKTERTKRRLRIGEREEITLSLSYLVEPGLAKTLRFFEKFPTTKERKACFGYQR